MTLTSIIGNLGSGKTLISTYFATHLSNTIFSNYKLKLPNYEPLELFDLINLPLHVNVIIDEAYAWIDSRTSGRAINRYCSYIILHSRKTFTNIIITTPLFSTVDIRFRLQSNFIIECQAIGKQLYNGITVPKLFHYTIINRENKTITYKDWKFENAIPYFQLYDTLEVIDSSEKEALEYYFIIRSPKLLKQKCLRIIDIVEKDIHKLTHISLKASMLNNLIPLQYEPYVYSYMSGKSKVD